LCAKPVEKARVKAASAKQFTPKIRSSIRRAELLRLAQFRKTNGVLTDAYGWLVLGLRTLAEKQADLGDNHTVDKYAAARILAQIGQQLPAMLVSKAIKIAMDGFNAAHSAKTYQEFSLADMKPADAGRLAELSRFERDELKIRTIEATDESRENRASRKATERRAKERHRIAEKRKKQGRIPREIYEQNSTSRAKPWVQLGISRATWHRRGKPEPAIETSRLQTIKEKYECNTLVSIYQNDCEEGLKAPSVTKSGTLETLKNAVAMQVINLTSVRRMIDEAAHSNSSIENETVKIRRAVRSATGKALQKALQGGVS
jgi:hypothetical protein